MKMPWFLDYAETKSTDVHKKCTNPEQLVENERKMINLVPI